MLPAAQRLTSPATFREVVRRGRRTGGPLLVVHLHRPAGGVLEALPDAARSTRAGLVVSKAVGPAVTRNRVKRRLRHLLREHLDDLAPGTLVVVRALPAAAEATYVDLGAELERCLAASQERVA